jgi:hypothetical protein
VDNGSSQLTTTAPVAQTSLPPFQSDTKNVSWPSSFTPQTQPVKPKEATLPAPTVSTFDSNKPSSPFSFPSTSGTSPSLFSTSVNEKPTISNSSSSNKRVAFDNKPKQSSDSEVIESQPPKFSSFAPSPGPVPKTKDDQARKGILKKPEPQSVSQAKKPFSPGSAAQSSSPKPATLGITPRQQRYNECAEYIARQLLLDPIDGLLYQYIAYSLEPMVKEIKSQVDHENATKEANEFRRKSLIRRFGAFWRRITHYNRKKREAGQRRQRMLEASMRRSAAAKEARAKTHSIRSEYPKAITGLGDAADHAEKLLKDREAARKLRFEQAESSILSKSSSLKPQSTRNEISLSSSRPPMRNHRRSHTPPSIASSQHKAITDKPESMEASQTSDPLRRSSGSRFLYADQLQANAASSQPGGRVSTFSSNYFKLKARGLTHLTDAYQERTNRKRQRTSTGEEPIFAQLHNSMSKSLSRSPPQEIGSRFSSPASEYYGSHSSAKRKAPGYLEPSLNKRWSKDDVSQEDEELFARARAVQSALTEGISVYQAEIEELRRSDSGRDSRAGQDLGGSVASGPSFFGDSVISFASPPPPASRSEVSRTSLANSMRTSKRADIVAKARDKLPAFWFRDSKFVPRSEYGLGPLPKRPRVEQVASSRRNNAYADFTPSESTSRPTSSKSNHVNSHMDLAQGALSQLTNGYAENGHHYEEEFGQGQPTRDDAELLFDDLETNGDTHIDITGQEYDEELQQGEDEDEEEGEEGEDSEEEGEEELYEEEYDDDEEGYTEEESEDDGHIPPAHLQGGNSAEDAIEL